MARSIMGNKIKVIDGIISFKTDLDEDITKYQINSFIKGENSEIL